MTTLPTVLISGASEELTAKIEQLIRSQVELSLTESITPDQAAAKTFDAKLVWIELQSNPGANLALLEKLVNKHPNTFFVVSKEELEPELVKKTMQIGALDFLDHKGWAAQIRSVIRRIMAKEFGAKPGAAPSSIASIPKPQTSAPGGSKGPTAGFRRVEPNRNAPPAATAGSATAGSAPARPAATPAPVTPAPSAPVTPVKPAAPAAVPTPTPATPAAAAKPATPTPAPAATPAAKPATPPPAPPAPAKTSAPEPPAAKPTPAPTSSSMMPDNSDVFSTSSSSSSPAPKPAAAPASASSASTASSALPGASAPPKAPPPPPSPTKAGGVPAAISADDDTAPMPTRTMGGRTPAFAGPKAPGPPPAPKPAKTPELPKVPEAPPAEPEILPEPAADEAEAYGPESEFGDEGDSAEHDQDDDSGSDRSLPLNTGEYQRPPRQSTPRPRQRIQSTTGPNKAIQPPPGWDGSSESDPQSNKSATEVTESAQGADDEHQVDELPVEYEREGSGSASFNEEETEEISSVPGAADQIDSIVDDISMQEEAASSDEEPHQDSETEDGPMSSAQDDEDKPGSSKDTAGGASQPSGKKGRWDELDSIISKEPTKAKEPDTAAKKASKWGDLDNLGANKTFQKDTPTSTPAATPSSSTKNKWGDLDSIGSSKSAAEIEIDEIAPEEDAVDEIEAEVAAPSGRAKWGDLDSIGTGKPAEKTDTGKSKWGDLDNLGSAPAASSSPAGAAKKKWGDLDSIGSKSPAAESGSGKSKWGDLDTIGGGGSGGAEEAEPGVYTPGPGDSGETPALISKNLEQVTKQNQQAFKNRFGKKTQALDMPEPSEGVTEGSKSGQWGDLDSIASPAAKESAEPKKWGDLDAIAPPKKPAAPEPAPVSALPQAQAPSQTAMKWKAGMDSDMNTGAREFGAMRDKIAGTKLPMPVVGWHNVNWLFAIMILGSALFFSVKFFEYPSAPASQAATK